MERVTGAKDSQQRRRKALATLDVDRDPTQAV
jgi:hypothetical protein